MSGINVTTGAATCSIVAKSPPAVVVIYRDREPLPQYLFRDTGAYVSVRFDGEEFSLENNLAAKLIGEMLRKANQTTPPADLLAIGNRKPGIENNNLDESDRLKSLDEKLQEHGRDLRKLTEERDNPGHGESPRDNLQKEIDEESSKITALLEERRKVVGINGRPKKTNRPDVSIRNAKKRLCAEAKSHGGKRFAKHIEKYVTIGNQCVYSVPEGTPAWNF